ncbi:MAG: GMC family oxidoreductase [Acidobacteria bacterium]|nr:GMC family oxidoreductase [Acidobacteriota bacterium]
MSRLALPHSQIKARYEVVVAGSGYGGSIAASRMARAGRLVCLLERGRELQPGEYPGNEIEAAAETQIDGPLGRFGPAAGLYDFRVNNEIGVFQGCGLGGTSLVNANVSLEPEPGVFALPGWPRQFLDDVPGLLRDGYDRAREMLKPEPYPETAPPLKKLAAMQASAAALGVACERPPLNVHFGPAGENHVGVEQRPCIACGDCVTGCNHRAKNTTLMNYLPDAVNHGAEIFTEAAVQFIEKIDGGWRVHYRLPGGGDAFEAETLSVEADIVMLGAGSLGSTEILLRSAQRGLAVSPMLGQRFSGNGDALGFAYNNDVEINGVGFGDRDPEGREPVGPTITGLIDLRGQPAPEDGMVIEEGSLAGPISGLLPVPLAGAALLGGVDTDIGFGDKLREIAREHESILHGPYRGAVRHTQTFLVMSHDDAGGRLVLENDRVRIHWPGVGAQPVFTRIAENLKQATKALGGTFVANPIWSPLLENRLVTVHPLGGCPMGTSAELGAVNHKGQVFRSAADSDVYEDLYVCDGAVIPRALGVNPLLTISAIAERCCAIAAEERGWIISYALPSRPAVARPAGLGDPEG